mmetsp:Transcript_10551/g.20642  ORF Transcript_10551/g.20642 Transcript_10551/m.20642 type:complete len:209 (-) Transcript_10551:222-848(-)
MTQIMEYLKRITPKDDMLPMQISIRIIRKQIKEKVYAQAEAALKKLEDVLKADKKREPKGWSTKMAVCHEQRAAISVEQNFLEKALKELKDAIGLFKKAKNRKGQASAWASKARVLIRRAKIIPDINKHERKLELEKAATAFSKAASFCYDDMYKETALIAAAKCREDIDRIEAKIREETSTTPGSSGRDELSNSTDGSEQAVNEYSE